MSKRMISTTERAETILSQYKAQGINISAQISDAVVCAELPQYNPLHTEGLYLLDTITNGLKDWRGPFRTQPTPSSDEDASYEAIKRGLSWAKNNRTQDSSVIEFILSHFETMWGTDGLCMDDIPEHLMKNLKSVQNKLSEESFGLAIGLGQLGNDILDEWDALWDDPEVYEALLTIVSFEKLRFPFKPFEALAILRGFEQTFIYEQITK